MGEWLTADEAAHLLKVSEQTMRTWMRSGQIPAAKIGRVWRVSAASIEDFLQQKQRRRPTEAKVDQEMRAWQDADLGPSLPPYDWGEVDPMTLGKPVRFIPGTGLVVGGQDGE